MEELERIKNNINGELPIDEEYKYIIVEGIKEPERELDIFKKSMITILENKHLHEEDSQWEKLLPKAVVAFTNQLQEEDYYKDDLISHLPSIIDSILRIRSWKWYSSELYDDGFEIVTIGKGLESHILWLLHHQGISHDKLFLGGKDYKYPTRALTDVLSYRTWNPETLELK